MSGVKLDVELRWHSNLGDLNKEVVSANQRLSYLSKVFSKNYDFLSLTDKMKVETGAIVKYTETFKRVYSELEKLNKKGSLSHLLGDEGYPKTRKNQVRLTPEQLETETKIRTEQELLKQKLEREKKESKLYAATHTTAKSYTLYKKRVAEAQKNEATLFGEITKTGTTLDVTESKFHNIIEKIIGKAAYARWKKNVVPYEKTTTKQINEAYAKYDKAVKGADYYGKLLEKGVLSSSKEWSKQLKENNKNSKNMGNLLRKILQGKWGAALGATVAGAAIYGGIKLLKAAYRYGYSTSQTGLDWQRTISGGASGGSWFGQGLAAYGRAGIAPNQYQGFKRGVQGYLGSVKLGMGNAAPLMYLGLSALSNPDLLEKELERSLRRLPKDVSLALAGQMGLDYNMWEAIYNGRLDRQRSAYSEEAIKEWADLGRSLNDLITTLNSFFFNTFAPIAEAISRIINNIIDKKSGGKTLFNLLGFGAGYINPMTQLQTLLRFGSVEVTVKDKNGEVIGKGESEVENTMFELG